MFTGCFRIFSHYCKYFSYLFFLVLGVNVGSNLSVCSFIALPIVSNASPSAKLEVNGIPILGGVLSLTGKLIAVIYLACILLYLSVNSFSFFLYSCIDIEPFLYLFACVVNCCCIPLVLLANSNVFILLYFVKYIYLILIPTAFKKANNSLLVAFKGESPTLASSIFLVEYAPGTKGKLGIFFSTTALPLISISSNIDTP